MIKPFSGLLSQQGIKYDFNVVVKYIETTGTKSINAFNLKKVKLNNEELALKSTVQQKLITFKR